MRQMGLEFTFVPVNCPDAELDEAFRMLGLGTDGDDGLAVAVRGGAIGEDLLVLKRGDHEALAVNLLDDFRIFYPKAFQLLQKIVAGNGGILDQVFVNQ